MKRTNYYNLYQYGNPRGFCDYLRTVYSNFCRFPLYSYEVIFDKGPLKKCFKDVPVYANTVKFCDEDIIRPYKFLNDFQGGVSEINNDTQNTNTEGQAKQYFTKFIEDRLSKDVNELLYKYTNEFGNDFMAIHIRCGDHNICNLKNPDIRIKENDAIKKIKIIKSLLGSDFNKCLLFTDSEKLRLLVKEDNDICNLKTFSHNIIHVAYNFLLNTRTENDAILTIAEWFFMSKAYRIYSVSTPYDNQNRLSSFSMMTSYLYGIPFYYLNDRDVLIEGFNPSKLWGNIES